MTLELKQLPKHIQQLIVGVRCVQSKTLGEPRDPEGTRLCKWCLQPVTAPRRKFWCSPECVAMFVELQNVPDTIYARDKATCRVCQKFIPDLQTILHQCWTTYRRYNMLHAKVTRREEILLNTPEWEQNDFWSDARHIKDVEEMGLAVTELERAAGRFEHYFVQTKSGIWKPKHKVAYNIDHIKPVCEGGTTTADNLRLICTWCHEKISAESAKRRRQAEYAAQA